jgi:hypothetical protein
MIARTCEWKTALDSNKATFLLHKCCFQIKHCNEDLFDADSIKDGSFVAYVLLYFVPHAHDKITYFYYSTIRYYIINIIPRYFVENVL